MITFTPAEKVCSVIPNSIFCERGQGQNEASLATNKLTLLYLSANYNYASSWGECVVNDENAPSAKRDPERSIGLYTFGRIFEQPITELEILEAEEEGRRRLDRRSSARNPASQPPAEQAAEPWPTIWKTNGRTIAKMNAGWADPRVLTCDEVSEISVPTLIVQGENISPWFSAMSETLARCQPNTLTVTMNGANYDGPYRKPDEFAEMILDFVAILELRARDPMRLGSEMYRGADR